MIQIRLLQTDISRFIVELGLYVNVGKDNRVFQKHHMLLIIYFSGFYFLKIGGRLESFSGR